MYTFMYVSTCACIYSLRVCLYICQTNDELLRGVYACIHACSYVCMHACLYEDHKLQFCDIRAQDQYTSKHTHTYTYIHTHTHTHTHIYIYIYIYICTCICIYMHVYTYTCTYTYTYTYTQTHMRTFPLGLAHSTPLKLRAQNQYADACQAECQQSALKRF